jgi:hypothetical protein
MTMPVFGAGQRLYAEDLNTIARQIDSLTDPGWTSYTPTWASSGTAPAIGNGTLTGRYRRAANSDLVIVEITQVWGSTTTNGTGLYNWTLPVTASSAAVTAIVSGSGQVTNAGDISQPCVSVVATTTQVVVVAGPCPNTATTVNSRGGQVGATVPFTFATSDTITLTVQYDAA